MGRGAVAEGGEAQRAGLGLGGVAQVGQRLQAAARMRGQHVLRHAHERDRAQVFLRVVGQLADQRLVGREAVGHADEGVAVGRGLGGGVDADHRARAGLVVDDHRLAQRLRQLRADEARDEVGGAAGGEGHDHADRPGGPCALRACERGQGRQCGRALQQRAAPGVHATPQ